MNAENYPLKHEALNPQIYESGLAPSQVIIRATRERRKGMKVKPFTFALNHTITKRFDDTKEAQKYGNQTCGGKGKGKGNS